MPRAARAGFDTWWTSYGQGPRRALMIHCSLASSSSWGGLARHLSGALTMTAFDMPGHDHVAGPDRVVGFQHLGRAAEPLGILAHRAFDGAGAG